MKIQSKTNSPDPFLWVTISCGMIVILFILLPMVEMILEPSFSSLKETITDHDVIRAIRLSLYTSGMAALISFIFGTPFAYLLARKNFPGKKIIESIVDIPIMIPHPVIGIAVLGIAGRNHWLGKMITSLGIQIMGSVTGIVVVLTFVGLPFYINTVKEAFESISPRLENVSRSLGASMTETFFRVTFPLSRQGMIVGIILCMARAISEFGAVIIVAYHPMIAPVMIYERFTAYGLKYSQPVAVWLIIVCLILFLMLRLFSVKSRKD